MIDRPTFWLVVVVLLAFEGSTLREMMASIRKRPQMGAS